MRDEARLSAPSRRPGSLLLGIKAATIGPSRPTTSPRPHSLLGIKERRFLNRVRSFAGDAARGHAPNSVSSNQVSQIAGAKNAPKGIRLVACNGRPAKMRASR